MRAREDTAPALTIDRYVATLGFSVVDVKSGWWEGVEQTRVAVIARL